MHIIFLNPQGNFDKNDSYWTMHPDFGGQLVYVKEIAVAMSQMGHTIDIVTRQIEDTKFPEFSKQIDAYPGINNLRIVRIPCGGKKFINKEFLWEHLGEWTDNIIDFYKNEGLKIDFMTGHYGDGGLACAMIKAKTKIPYSFTGHSLGAQKLEKLGCTLSNFDDIERKYNFTKRIIAERTAMKYSNLIFVSTEQERDDQYSHLLYRDITRHLNPLNFIVTPPGANTKVFAPFQGNNVLKETTEIIEKTIERDILEERRSFPFIISASRLDSKKNHVGLIRSFAKNNELSNRANLLISVRGIEDAFKTYQTASIDELVILDEIFDIIHEYDLKGKITFMSINSQNELADIYRYLTKRKSIFTLTALYEPFGLAPIEAMSTGLPAVVTMYGGPSDVLEENNEFFGVLVDVFDEPQISEGLLKALNNYDYFKSQGMKRVREKYTWEVTASKYLEAINNVMFHEDEEKINIDNYFLHPEETVINTEFLKNMLFKNN